MCCFLLLGPFKTLLPEPRELEDSDRADWPREVWMAGTARAVLPASALLLLVRARESLVVSGGDNAIGLTDKEQLKV